MSYVLRTWFCLNAECGNEFEDGGYNPPCPSCGCVRVQYVPGGGHVLHASTRVADSTVRRVAQNFGLTNLRSARAGEPAHPGRPARKQISGTAPMNVGLGLGVQMTERPYAEFQSMSRPMTGNIPIHGRFKRPSKLPPMNVRHVHSSDKRR
jgi:hypothetical protein